MFINVIYEELFLAILLCCRQGAPHSPAFVVRLRTTTIVLPRSLGAFLIALLSGLCVQILAQVVFVHMSEM